MGIAAADADLAPLFCQLGGIPVSALEHVTVFYLDGWKIFAEPVEILKLTSPGNAGENVVDAEEQPLFGEVH